jgi:hypothetical protein
MLQDGILVGVAEGHRRRTQDTEGVWRCDLQPGRCIESVDGERRAARCAVLKAMQE